MILSCKEATERASLCLDRQLSWPQRLSLRLHLLICHRCRCYLRQLRFLQQIAPRINQQIEAGTTRLPAEARERIDQQLRQQSR